MMFHKRDIVKTVYILLFLVTIITANNRKSCGRLSDDSGDEDLVIVFSSSESEQEPVTISDSVSEEVLLESEPEPVTISDGVSEEVFLDNPCCWDNLKIFCEVENPQAIDFAKAVIRKWKTVDVFIYHYPDNYYNEFHQYLNAENILSPDEFCATLDTEDTPRNEDQKTECQSVLSCFGGTNETALQHCFFEKIKREPLRVLWARERELEGDTSRAEHENSHIHGIDQIPFSNHKYFTDQYMKHMSQNVGVKPGIISPLKFCKYLEETELEIY